MNKYLHLLGLLVLTFTISANEKSKSPESPSNNHKQPDIVIIDVRTEKEYRSGHIQAAIHIPHDEIKEKISAYNIPKQQNIILYCGSGRRAERAKNLLEKIGYTKVENAGGYKDLKKKLDKK